MHRRAEIASFLLWFVALSVGLGWLAWTLTSSVGSNTLNLMLLVPVISAMLAARGFSWKRKLTYSAIALAVYVLTEILYSVTGLRDVAIRQALESQSTPSIALMLYQVFVTAFPLAMLVIFVGRTPTLLWSKSLD